MTTCREDSTGRCYLNSIYRGFCTRFHPRILVRVDELRRRVADRVISLRAERGWSQEELGARSGLTYKFIGEVERGQKNPSLESLGAIARGFGMDIVDLLSAPRARESYPRLGEDPLVAVREARDSLDRVLFQAGKSGRRRKK
ncbi:MAG: helix-turn-helix transcriptional regulator [Acidimicrobiia bacterium]|nr:helix-turn-helix transcriptional regulator [Acidimicrobiia bacterium]